MQWPDRLHRQNYSFIYRSANLAASVEYAHLETNEGFDRHATLPKRIY